MPSVFVLHEILRQGCDKHLEHLFRSLESGAAICDQLETDLIVVISAHLLLRLPISL